MHMDKAYQALTQLWDHWSSLIIGCLLQAGFDDTDNTVERHSGVVAQKL